MKTSTTCFTLLFTTAMFTAPAHATTGNWLIGGEVTFGGDELGATYSDSGKKLDELNAGELFNVYGGYDFLLNNDTDNSLSLRATFGWIFDSVSAENGDVYFDRYPLNFILHQQLNNLDLGAGFTYHLNPTFDGSDIGEGKVTFDDALGFRVELGYPLNEQTDITFSATAIDYKVGNSDDLSGNNIGVGVRLRF